MSSEHAPSREVIGLDIETPYGPLRARLALPSQPMRLAELAASFMGFSERLVQLAVEREEAAGRRVSCRAGCGACCRQLVPLSPPEAWMIADLVEALGPERKDALLARFAGVRDALAASGLQELDARPGTGTDAYALAAMRYYLAGKPCPFLLDEACSIHPMRPSICREYLVTSPPERCGELFQLGKRGVDRIQVGVRLSEGLSRLAARLLDRDVEVVPLGAALEWAAAHREEGARRWPPRELVEQLVGALGPQRDPGLATPPVPGSEGAAAERDPA